MLKGIIPYTGLKRAQRYYQDVIHAGTSGITDEEKFNRIRLTNLLSVYIGVAIIAITPLVYACIPKVSLLIPIFIELIINFSVILLNRLRMYRLAGLVLYFLQCAAIIYFCFLLGGLIQLQSMVIFLLSIICLLFKEIPIRIIALTGAIVTFIVLQTGYYYNVVTPIEVSRNAGYLIQTAAMVGVIIMLVLIARPFIASNDMNPTLRRKNYYIKMFVTQITHEIRSPLNAIGLISKLLKKEIKKDPSLKRLEPYADMLIVGSNTTRTIVNNVLDMAQIESGKTKTGMEQTFFVKPFFSKLIDVSKIIAQSRKMRIRLLIDQMPSLITSDPLKLNQILNNLLSNAIKYGKKDSTITVTVSKSDNRHWSIEVKNFAHSIPTENLNQLFDPFVTGNTDVTEGTGLGLYIVRNKVVSMNGTIEAEYTTDQYVVFRIMLPLLVGKSKDVEPEDEEAELQDLSNTRVLIAEDEPINARALFLCLEDLGCKVEIARNGKELITKALTEAPDIIMMDYHMPLMNGETAMRHLKNDPQLKNIPVIVSTGDIFTNSLDKLLEAGADGYIAKPIESGPLRRILCKHLYQKNDELQDEQ